MTASWGVGGGYRRGLHTDDSGGAWGLAGTGAARHCGLLGPACERSAWPASLGFYLGPGPRPGRVLAAVAPMPPQALAAAAAGAGPPRGARLLQYSTVAVPHDRAPGGAQTTEHSVVRSTRS
eukprot:CAMPEP_0185545334 /NCGR_PEP_ID=MMETSP1381-20130426/4693_1 /TAXON_ID=298111 /ORGANISM="Pavlova sp., Strain CCMP459" /LENGTH=121 /DNA_ID=CAMNT_0028157643 /DNA_START=361 /DNA_END=727 /DNA_ORIENTATION=-